MELNFSLYQHKSAPLFLQLKPMNKLIFWMKFKKYDATIINQHATKWKVIKIILQCLQPVLDIIQKKI